MSFAVASPLPRRQEHLRHLASRVESSGARRRHDVLRIVSWRRVAGDAVDADALTEAARRCVAVDPDEAEALARLAIDAGARSCRRDRLGAAADVQSACRRCSGAARRSARCPCLTRGRGGARRHAREQPHVRRSAGGKTRRALLDDLAASVDDPAVRAELAVADRADVALRRRGRREQRSSRRPDRRPTRVALVDRVRARITRVAGFAVTARPVTAQRRSCSSRSRPSVAVSKDCRWRRAKSRPGSCSRCSGRATSTPRTALRSWATRTGTRQGRRPVARRLRGPPRRRRVVAGTG